MLSALLPGPVAITVAHMRGGKRAEREEEEEFSSLLCAQSSLLLPIPPLMLLRLSPLKLAKSAPTSGFWNLRKRHCRCCLLGSRSLLLFLLCSASASSFVVAGAFAAGNQYSTDGSRILGLGVWSSWKWQSIGKLDLYITAAGINPKGDDDVKPFSSGLNAAETQVCL
ncbi:hypothetical protein Ahy_B07g087683 isoform E [Arachis hypogaea]|uniref:Uncharacterized protein n=1 Tax=Arachis hypogaea TaxID=3818 RepID=A0A444YCQ4_ARAHY|nr:hypothetical protein Ahy_B07g087683 isoform E [Arachis hypogaea]